MLNGGLLLRCDAIGLVEMLVALSVAAIILVLGVPSMTHWMHGFEVRSSASDLAAALQAARAEAIARNQDVRVTLGDDQGRGVWMMGCVTVTHSCPRRLRGVDTPSARLARWGATIATGAPELSTALPAGLQLPAQVTFNALGTATAIGSGAEVFRIDILHAADTTAQRLVVLLAASGMIRVCDPALGSGQPSSCL